MNIRELLREETRSEHHAIEGIMPFARPGFDRAGYQALLERFYAFYQPLEEKFLDSADLRERGFDYSARVKTPLLEQDIRNLGGEPARVAPAPASALPAFSSSDELLGALYVVEGSTLGGQVLSKNLSEKLHLNDEQTSFYSSYGVSTGQKWAEFLAFLKAQNGDSAKNARVLEGARETFRSLRLWLERA